MTKTMSNQAQAAKMIRAELKKAFPKTKFFVTSTSFSMGDAVDIRWTDGPITSSVEEITGKYRYGHFNGMKDIYEYSNKKSDLPQSKYVMTSREYSQDANDKVKLSLSKKFDVDMDDEEKGCKKLYECPSRLIRTELQRMAL